MRKILYHKYVFILRNKENTNLDPIVIGQCWPDVVWLSDGGFVRFENDFGLVRVDVHAAHDQNDSRERGVRRNCLEQR